MSVEEYLRTTFNGPEPDYLDGKIIERHLGSKKHSRVQKRLILFFEALSESQSWEAYPEQTLELSPTRFRVADVAVLSSGDPAEAYPTNPPLIVVEVVSKDGSHAEILKKLADYHAWGVKHVWSADPWVNKLFMYDDRGYHEVPAFELLECGAKLTASELFAA